MSDFMYLQTGKYMKNAFKTLAYRHFIKFVIKKHINSKYLDSSKSDDNLIKDL